MLAFTAEISAGNKQYKVQITPFTIGQTVKYRVHTQPGNGYLIFYYDADKRYLKAFPDDLISQELEAAIAHQIQGKNA